MRMSTSLLSQYQAAYPKASQKSQVLAFLAQLDHMKEAAPSVFQTVVQELELQRSHLKLIASENFSSLTTQLAMGNLLTDKYCEGYPYHRFYAGCENVDFIEQRAVDLAKQIFNVDHAYVQPHSGADANLVAFWAILTEKIQNPFMEKLGQKRLDQITDAEFETLRNLLCNQTCMGLSLSSGGHLTHGFRHNLSAKMMRAVTYDVDPKTHLLNYDAIAKQARACKPLILIAGYSAYPRAINFAKLREIADEVGAVLLVDMAHFAGLVAGGVFTGEENPTAYAHILTTTTHKTLRGPRGGLILCENSFKESIDRGCPLALGGPLPHVIAAKAVGFEENLSPNFQDYAKQIVKNAKALAKGLMDRGVTVISGGTDNHLVLIDCTNQGLTGRIAESVLYDAKITANRNMIPFDPNGAWYTSGVRLGTPALTTIGMKEEQMDQIAEVIALLLKNTKPNTLKDGSLSRSKAGVDPKILEKAKEQIGLLLKQFPLYPEIGEIEY